MEGLANQMEAEVRGYRLGSVGVWLGRALGWVPWAAEREAAAEVESLGFGAIWYSESRDSKESLTHAALLLAATRTITVASGIANIRVRDPMAMVAGTSALADAYGERLVLGMGASHPHQLAARGHDHGRPVATMREYLAAMDEARYTGPAPSTPIPRVLGALRPPMLELARECADGAHPYFVTAEHTARAREILGLGKILAPELWVLLETNPERARALSRDAIARYLTLAHHTKALLWLGFSEEDFQDGGSDRLVDALVAWGDEDSIRERVREHLEAGATHVCIQPVPVTEDDVGLDQLRRLAPAVIDLEVSCGT